LLVGNDVVDLRDPENQPGAIHPRFDERVFTSTERERLTNEATVHRTRWLMWAAKESAFKVGRKLDLRVRFLPRLFSVQLEGKTSAVVRHAVGRFQVSFSGGDDWVHAIATRFDGAVDDASGPSAMVERVQEGRFAPAYVSARVRSMARAAVGSVLSIAPPEIEIATAAKIPVALWRKLPLPVDLSLSHHGSFLACAWSQSETPPSGGFTPGRRAGFDFA